MYLLVLLLRVAPREDREALAAPLGADGGSPDAQRVPHQFDQVVLVDVDRYTGYKERAERSGAGWNA